jgi:hypothetical protein
MKVLLLMVVLLGVLISTGVAQKKSTIMGDIVIGELTGMDEATHEITIKYPGKEGTEIFSGILVDGYKLRREDGRPGNVEFNEILPGMHIRVFYKSGQVKVNGQEKKVNKIHRLDFLGKDEHDRLRNQLNIDPTIPVAVAEKDDLPAMSPLKLYPAIAYSNVQADFVAWIDKWNRKNGDGYGKLEVVSSLQQADISIVVARGADSLVAVLPMSIVNPDYKGELSQTTTYLVVKDPGGLKVLWTKVVPVMTSSNTEAYSNRFESVMGELEKRLKARPRDSKK